MKLRLNKKVLADMPDQVRELVTKWAAQYRKNFISVETVPQFYPGEDARVTILNLTTDKSQTARIAGDFAGTSAISPNAAIPLPHGCVAVVTGFFLGHPWLTVYQGGEKQPLKLSGVMVECDAPTRAGFGCNMDFKP